MKRRRILVSPWLLATGVVFWIACTGAAAGVTQVSNVSSSVAGDKLLPNESNESSRRQCVIVVLDRTSWFEWRAAKAPNLHRLIARGAAGLMNARTIGDPNPYGSWLTLGAGRGAVGREPIGYAEEWRRQIRYFGLDELARQNRAAHTRATPGLLGQTLRAAGLKTAVIGNSDSDPVTKDGRLAATLAMDTRGHIDGGEVGSWLLEGSGGKTQLDLPELKGRLRACLSSFDFLVVDFGDTVRADRSFPPRSAFSLTAAKAEALARADSLLGEILSLLEGRSTLLIALSPSCPAFSSPELRTLAPIVISFPGESGLLHSEGTRHTGIVSTVDFAPTVLSYFRLPIPTAMTGRPLSVRRGRPERLDAIQARTTTIYRLRYPVLRLYLGAAAGLSTILVLLLWLQGPAELPSGRRDALCQRKGASAAAAALASLLLALPLAFLLLAFFSPTRPAQAILLLLALNLAIAAPALALRRPRARLGFICGLTSLFLLADVCLGSRLMERSLLGFDPIIGNRFYGIGNEFMAALVAAAAIAAGALLPARPLPPGRRAAVFAALLFIVYAIGSPSLGANWGGGVTAAIAFAALLTALPGGSRWRKLAVSLLAVLAAAFGLILLGLAGDHPSHFTRAALEARESGGLLALAGRKLAMNLRLLRGNPGHYLGIALLVGLVSALFSRRSPLRRLLAAQRPLSAGLLGAGAGLVAAALFNDSGLVAAACAAMVLLPSLILLRASACLPGGDRDETARG
jgi:hypothetical protein